MISRSPFQPFSGSVRWWIAQTKSLFAVMGEASEYYPSPRLSSTGILFSVGQSSPFSTKTGLISLKQLHNKSLDVCPENLSSVPAALVVLGQRSSLCLLGRERLFNIVSLLLTCLTFWNHSKGDATALLKMTHLLVTSAVGQRPELLPGVNSGQDQGFSHLPLVVLHLGFDVDGVSLPYSGVLSALG